MVKEEKIKKNLGHMEKAFMGQHNKEVNAQRGSMRVDTWVTACACQQGHARASQHRRTSIKCS